MDKCGKVTPSNPSPNSFMQQNERKSSRTRSLRGRSSSGRTSQWPCKDYQRGSCNNSFCEEWHPPECFFYKNKNGCRFAEKCPFAHRQVDEQPTKKGLKRMMTKVQWLFWRKVIGENEDLLPTKVTIDRGNLVRGVIKIWDKIHLNAKHCKYNTSCTWNSRTYFWYTKATEHCAQPQAHSHLHSDQCYQLHERHDSHRRDNRAPLSTMRAVCRWVTHTVTLAQVSISSMVIVMRMVVWALV